MKAVLILAILVLTACSKNNEIIKNNNSSEKINIDFLESPVLLPIEITLGEAVTDIVDTGENRVSNIELVCGSISGFKLDAGEEFSFNDVVGERSSERGYKYAPIIYNGEKSYGIGGGICQVSTTLYMAALNAKLEITERHCHSESVAYAPNHTDATVVFGEKDFKFKNNTDDTIYIYAWKEENKVFSKIIKKSVDIQE